MSTEPQEPRCIRCPHPQHRPGECSRTWPDVANPICVCLAAPVAQEPPGQTCTCAFAGVSDPWCSVHRAQEPADLPRDAALIEQGAQAMYEAVYRADPESPYGPWEQYAGTPLQALVREGVAAALPILRAGIEQEVRKKVCEAILAVRDDERVLAAWESGAPRDTDETVLDGLTYASRIALGNGKSS